MTTQRDIGSPSETSLAAFVANALPDKGKSCMGSVKNESNNNEIGHVNDAPPSPLNNGSNSLTSVR
jgi:hypothetical protein